MIINLKRVDMIQEKIIIDDLEKVKEKIHDDGFVFRHISNLQEEYKSKSKTFAVRLILFLCKIVFTMILFFLFLYLISHAQLFDALVINLLGRG